MLEKLRHSPRYLHALAGARQEVLAQCPGESVKFESLAWSILITSGMAVVSMWFALSSAMGVNGFLAIFPALAWGLVIMGIDRWLITSMPNEGKRRLFVALPRLAMAFLLGTLISTPFVLRIFESEINAQISVIKEQRYNDFIAAQQKSNVGGQVDYWSKQVASLQKVIDSSGAVPLDPAADPDVKALTAQRDKELQLEAGYFKTWQCQLYGVYQGVTCPKGNGPLAKASENSYNQAKAQVTQLAGAISAREKQLAATDSASQKLRLDQAKTALPNAQNQLHIAQTREDNLRTAFNAQNDALNGILIRLQALSQLSKGDFTVTSARFLVFLLFLVIEILPVTVKLLQKPGPYEEIYGQMQRNYVKNARKSGYRPPAGGGDSHGADGSRVIAGYAEPAGESVRDIWKQTKILPRGFDGSPDRQPTEVLHDGNGLRPGPAPGYGASHGNGAGGEHGRSTESDTHQGGYRDGEFSQAGGSRGTGFQRGTTASSHQAGHQPAPTRNDRYPAPTRNEGYSLPARGNEHAAPTRNDGYPVPARDDGRLAGLPLDETRRDLSNLPPARAGAPNPFTDSGGMSLAQQSLLNFNDDRPPGDSGPQGGDLNWDED